MAQGQEPAEEQGGNRPGHAERRWLLRVPIGQQVRHRPTRILRKIRAQLTRSEELWWPSFLPDLGFFGILQDLRT